MNDNIGSVSPEDMAKKKKRKRGCLVAFAACAFLFLLLMIIAINSGDEKTDGQEKSPEELQEAMEKWHEKNQEKLKQDSLSLVNYINERIGEKWRKLITIGFEAFNNNDQCLLQIGIPDNGWEGQDEVGKFICQVVVEWFVENGRDLEDVEIGALVYSPRKGVSGRESWRIWGFATYRYKSDDIKWYNPDEMKELLPDMVYYYED